jgi:putative endonuclease
LKVGRSPLRLEAHMSHIVYILRSQTDGTYYVGATGNLAQRVEKHNSGASLFTRTRRPWDVVYVEEHSSAREALVRERAIKRRKSRKYIDSLIRSHPIDVSMQMT